MTTFYNQIAGQNLHRLSGLVDGVFAIAMTLLVLDLAVPASETIHSESDLWTALLGLLPRLITYLMSFLTLGIFWVGQETTAQLMSRSDRHYTWITLAFLMAIALIPFSTAFLSEFIGYRVALLVYWLNLMLIGLTMFGSGHYLRGHKLLKDDVPDHFFRALRRRILVGQSLYAIGAALCVFDTRWSIGVIFATQLLFAIAPPVKLLNRF